MQKILLRGQNIMHAYQEGKIQTPVLKGVNLEIEASKMTAIVGKSGSGKSTLLHILGTLDSPNSGEVFFQDVDITKFTANEKAQFRNRHLGFVYQFHHLLGDFSALENVMLPLLIDKVERRFALERATYLLDRVGLKDQMNHLPSELSGGERQRVAIARALVHSPELILADEPTGNLDESNASLVFDLFAELVHDEHASVVMVTHDKTLADKCDMIMEIVDGTISSKRRGKGYSKYQTQLEPYPYHVKLKPEAKEILASRGLEIEQESAPMTKEQCQEELRQSIMAKQRAMFSVGSDGLGRMPSEEIPATTVPDDLDKSDPHAMQKLAEDRAAQAKARHNQNKSDTNQCQVVIFDDH